MTLCDSSYAGYRHKPTPVSTYINEYKYSALRGIGKLECLIYEMLLIIKEKRPTFNTQADSIRTKLFNYLTFYLTLSPLN